MTVDTREEAARRCPETSKADSVDEAGDLSKQATVIRESLGYNAKGLHLYSRPGRSVTTGHLLCAQHHSEGQRLKSTGLPFKGLTQGSSNGSVTLPLKQGQRPQQGQAGTRATSVPGFVPLKVHPERKAESEMTGLMTG